MRLKLKRPQEENKESPSLVTELQSGASHLKNLLAVKEDEIDKENRAK